MRKVISARDVEEMLRAGADLASIPADALLTPSARDMIRDAMDRGAGSGRRMKPAVVSVSERPAAAAPPPPPAPAVPPAAPSAPAAALPSTLNSRSSRAALESFFVSPACQELKRQICTAGHKMWQRAYVDGNGGNLAIRVGEDLVLCTPTLVSKGELKPEDLCLVDFQGNQILGEKKRTSEILMHLQIMQRQPKARASAHGHPPYATAFAVAGIEPPTCVIPEYEVFCAVAIAPYRTPGTPEMGKLVADLAEEHNTILMANHGVVTWSHNSVEEAYWRMEIIEAYCRTLVVAAQLGKPLKTFSTGQMKDLLSIKQGLGFVDPRYGLRECELCDNDGWRPGVACAASPAQDQAIGPDPEAEALVRAITDRIMASPG